jgi:hypothetical protein
MQTQLEHTATPQLVDHSLKESCTRTDTEASLRGIQSSRLIRRNEVEASVG